MNSIQSLKKIVLTMCIGMGLTAPALANMIESQTWSVLLVKCGSEGTLSVQAGIA